MKKLLITGTDTDVGKTWISSLLLRHLVRSGYSTGAYKPVCSGAITSPKGKFYWSDVEELAKAVGCADRDLVCPQRFQAAVAPNVAAGLEGRSVSDRLMIDSVNQWDNHAELLLIEGAGGLCCPLSDEMCTVDLAKELQTPIVIVAANRLGVINHTLMTVAVARSRGLHVAAVILNNVREASIDDKSISSNGEQLAHWLPECRLLSCDHGQEAPPWLTEEFVSGWFA